MVSLVNIDVARDAPLATAWINAPGGAQMLQLMGMLVPDDFTTTIIVESKRFQDILSDPSEIAQMIEVDGQVVGIVEMHTDPFEGLGAPNISIMIGDASARGKGVGTAAMQLAIAQLQSIGYKIVHARALTRNAPSLAMLKKLGFVNAGSPYVDDDKLSWQNVSLSI
jgi:RimJ/RimL family protein N-acetyltransferase